MEERVPEHRVAPASSSRESSEEPVWKEVPGKHGVKTHFPKERKCEMQEDQNHKGPCKKRIGEAIPKAEHFGDLVSADHKVLSEGCESRVPHSEQQRHCADSGRR